MKPGRALTIRERSTQRVRASASGTPDANSEYYISVYKVPLGYTFEARRVAIDLGNAVDNNIQNIGTLQGQGGPPRTYWQYYRSGQFLAWGMTHNPPVTPPSLPGIETWGEEEGPILYSGEVFELRARLVSPPLIVGTAITITLEGILTEAGSTK